MTVCGLEDVNSGTLLAASLSGEWAVALSCGPAAELMPFSPAACNVTARSANAVSDPFTDGGIGLRENESAFLHKHCRQGPTAKKHDGGAQV